MRDVFIYFAIGLLEALFTKMRWGRDPHAPDRIVLLLSVLAWPLGLTLWVLGPILRRTRFGTWVRANAGRRHAKEVHHG